MRGTLFLAALGASCAAPSPPAFEADGKPIHPACVYELLTSLSDLRPRTAAVDVEGCTGSNRHSGNDVSEFNGGLLYRNSELFGQGFFIYRHLGATPDGVHVLLTAESGGGSGVFHEALFVTLERRAFLLGGVSESRWVLSSLGQVSLGDRTEDAVFLQGRMLLILSPEGGICPVPVPARNR